MSLKQKLNILILNKCFLHVLILSLSHRLFHIDYSCKHILVSWYTWFRWSKKFLKNKDISKPKRQKGSDLSLSISFIPAAVVASCSVSITSTQTWCTASHCSMCPGLASKCNRAVNHTAPLDTLITISPAAEQQHWQLLCPTHE